MLARGFLRNIIHRYVQPRSPFDKTNFIEGYIPPSTERKPRQEKWDNPEYHWPADMPRYSKLQNRALVQEVENEYLEQIKTAKKLPDIQTGDMVEVTTFQSMSTAQTSTFQGVCIGKRRHRTINSSINILGAVDGVQIEMHIKLHSPMVKEVKIVEKAKGHFRARLNFMRDLTITKYKALQKGVTKRLKTTVIAKATEKAMRQRIIRGEIPDDGSDSDS
jgi:ribosomal protein L19